MESPWLWIPLIIVGVLVIQALRRRKQMCSFETYAQLKTEGAQLIDCRSVAEFETGHAPGTKNIPVEQIPARIQELDPSRPVVLCCASGGRAQWAAGFLRNQGFDRVENMGPWQRMVG